MRVCSFEDCEELHLARGWCNTHYHRWWRHGDPGYTEFIHGDDEARFWSYIDTSGDCWEWIGAKRERYGRMTVAGRSMPAHRFAYELLVSPIPDGLTIDHLCRNRACVNPDHLEPVTRSENTRRERLARTVQN